MSLPMPIGVAVDLASGVLLTLLGGAIATIKPRSGGNLVLAGFSASYGLIYVFWNLRSGGAFDVALRTLQGISMASAGALLVLLALRFPRPVAADERRLLALPVVLTGAFFLALALPALERGTLDLGDLEFVVYYGGIWFALALLPIQHAAHGGTEGARDRMQARLLHGALVLFPAFLVGGGLMDEPAPVTLASLCALALVVALWIRATARALPGEGRHPRNAALLPLALVLAGMLASTLAPGGFPTVTQSGLHGLLRTLTVLILAYAILRHQLLGLDVRVRWTLSRGTIAAVFIAMFFVVSETAQQFLGETIGSTYAGIAAAGALVFAIAPLQRAAERFAARAVPVAAPGNPAETRPGSRAEEAYRAVLRRYLRDGALTRDEERALAILAGELRLDAGRAFELREETERETLASREVP